MALMAHDPADLVDQLILLTGRLADLAERQAALFEASRFADVAPLTDEAQRLAATYALESRRLAQDPTTLEAAPRALKLALKVETERFRTALAAHERTIERQRVLAEGLVRAIAEEAVAARPTPIAYGPGAQMRRDTAAVALDRRA
jgi:hypothetical protein